MAIRYDQEDLRAAIAHFTGGKGADVVYDPVGGSVTEAAFRSLGWNGRLLVVGFAAGKIPRPAAQPSTSEVRLGSRSGSGATWWNDFRNKTRANAAQLQKWCEAGLISPHVDRVYPFEEATAGLAYLADRRVMGRACLAP